MTTAFIEADRTAESLCQCPSPRPYMLVLVAVVAIVTPSTCAPRGFPCRVRRADPRGKKDPSVGRFDCYRDRNGVATCKAAGTRRAALCDLWAPAVARASNPARYRGHRTGFFGDAPDGGAVVHRFEDEGRRHEVVCRGTRAKTQGIPCRVINLREEKR